MPCFYVTARQLPMANGNGRTWQPKRKHALKFSLSYCFQYIFFYFQHLNDKTFQTLSGVTKYRSQFYSLSLLSLPFQEKVVVEDTQPKDRQKRRKCDGQRMDLTGTEQAALNPQELPSSSIQCIDSLQKTNACKG